jgi:hypothetical protein
VKTPFPGSSCYVDRIGNIFFAGIYATEFLHAIIASGYAALIQLIPALSSVETGRPCLSGPVRGASDPQSRSPFFESANTGQPINAAGTHILHSIIAGVPSGVPAAHFGGVTRE